MGGRGSSYSRSVAGRRQRITLPGSNQQGNAADANSSTPIPAASATAISQMDDAEIAALAQAAQNTDLPNHLNDYPNITQRFVYAAGLNSLPTVLNQSDFDDFLAQNNIPRSDIIARSVNPASYTSGGLTYNLTAQQVNMMLVHSRLNYIGGKVGGSLHGCGSYFAQTGGSSTGYGSTTITGVLNPATARVIDSSRLRNLAAQYMASHPQFVSQVGKYSSGSPSRNNMSIYALALGYNVISDGSGPGTYYNVIDRSALVIRE